ncbi:hypothetical protein Cva_00313 [Caedimonas varicaedens]|jgi:hypothetical protein|uniref:DUF2975 domain-containing protein n=1 Tax=Caedimonas varicaedens TaxID=1629334 RepID=A0A0K8MB42_9PROT|nr:hypothetical protein Cva_00313 [Caedimonas varicaedens]
MDRIQKVSSYLLIIFNVLLIALPLLIILQWIFIETKITDVGSVINFFGTFERTIQTPEGFVNLSTIHWTPPLKILGLSSDILGLLPLLLSLFVLKSIFRNYQQGEIFSTANATHYRSLGWLFFLDALLIKSLSNTLLVLAVTFTNPPGHRYLTVSFGTPNMKPLFCGILVIVISWVMLEASKLQDEQKFTI